MRIDDLDSAEGLLPGMYRGISLSIIDSASEHGRRLVEYLFPGLDPAAYDDFGVAPSIITIEALYIADDYRAAAVMLAAAFETAGPGLLVHPWLGPMSVIMEEPAEIRFSERELRVIRVSARFKRAPVASFLSSSSGLLSAGIVGLVSAASSIALAIASSVMSSAKTSAVIRSRRIVISAAASIAAPKDARASLAALRNTLASSSPSAPLSFDAWLVDAAAIVSQVQEVPAVAPVTEAAATPSAQALMTIGISLANKLLDQARSVPSNIDGLLLIEAAAHFITQVAAQSAYADFASRQEALSFRSGMTSSLKQLVDRIEEIGTDQMQGPVTDLVRASTSLSASIVADINEIIGRLPSVRRILSPRDADTFAVAQHLAGDTPSKLEAVYLDLVTRNDPVHPAQLPAGYVEFLEF